MAATAHDIAAEQRRLRSSTFTPAILVPALWASVVKLDPRWMVRNPVMFVVEIGAVLTAALTIDPTIFGGAAATRGYNLLVTVILVLTVVFANYAEAVAEGRGRAQAATLRKTKKETPATRLRSDGTTEQISSAKLRKGDIVVVSTNEIIPGDGDVIEGVAYVNEAAITGESAPVLKEPGTDTHSSVTGGTQVATDSLKIRITADPGETFLDRMIALVEGAKRQKTPNEIALTALLAVFTIIFLIVCVTIVPFAAYLGSPLDIATVIALLVCLIPTTIGALLSAIGIAGMDRVTRFNVLAMSGRSVEAAGDINTLLLDKTGTITFGNRLASKFIPASGHTERELAEAALLSSLADETVEGRSIVALAKQLGVEPSLGPGAQSVAEGDELIPFSAETRMSGVVRGGRRIMKGAVDAIEGLVGRPLPEMRAAADVIGREGGTPLGVAVDSEPIGVIYLKDTVKPGMRERFADFRKMGIRTVMVTGDNPLTAGTIAREAGVDDYIAQAKPEDKIRLIKAEQDGGRLVAMTGDGTNDAPALAQADVALALNSGTSAAKEAANMVDLDSDPTKLLDVVMIGKQLLITRGAITTFSIANDVAKYFAIIPAMFVAVFGELSALNVMQLATPKSAILSALIFNAVVIPLLIPLALRGVRYRPTSADALLLRNISIYGLGGIVAPFIGIKLIDLVVGPIAGGL
ncbi:MAG TPA: potassium-transporting ATPase subunit KdpB [Candidatus Acidoferrales bacterium]|nr:potassium-transporting ATPase subunit KdpB [Candidatus Acidoferrales bacterium]